MNRFAKGLIAGGILGAFGATMAVGEKKTKKMIMKSGKKLASETENMIDDMKGKLW